MENSQILLFCPICRSKPEHGKSEFEDGIYFYVVCNNNEEFPGHIVMVNDITQKESFRRWNIIPREYKIYDVVSFKD